MIITLTTDFGSADPFVGIMKGVILGIAPNTQLVDITHDIRAYDVLEPAFIIDSAYRYFPDATVHVVVVDPGVGSARRHKRRSEEHTSELQSHHDLVCRLLLEKKNK